MCTPCRRISEDDPRRILSVVFWLSRGADGPCETLPVLQKLLEFN
jgi:hypothetical protein